MDAQQRRDCIVDELRHAQCPLSGAALSQTLGVSRQVIVQDIAILRANGHGIVATNRGYIMPRHEEHASCVRLFKLQHTVEETEDELTAIVDLGGTVLDVMVNHRVYGEISATLNIKSRRDVARFIDDMNSGRSSLLMTVTSGYHFHHIAADTEEILDDIALELTRRGYVAQLLEHEKIS